MINLTKTKSYDKSETGSIQNDLDITNEELIDEPNYDNDGVPTDSDLDTEEYDVLKKLPTWKKLKLSVYERRQRYRRRQKNLQRLKQQQVSTQKYVEQRLLIMLLNVYDIYRLKKRKKERNSNKSRKKLRRRNVRKRRKRKAKSWRKLNKMMTIKSIKP